MFCGRCGKEIDNEAVMCVHCGVLTKKESNSKSEKERSIYIVLGIFLGVFGAHNFYAGYNKLGIAKLATTLFSIVLFVIGIVLVDAQDTEDVGAVVCFFWLLLAGGVWIWAIVDSLVIDRDSNGNLFK